MRYDHVATNYGECWDIEPVPDMAVPLERAWYAGIARPALDPSHPARAQGQPVWVQRLLRAMTVLSVASIAMAAGRVISRP